MIRHDLIIKQVRKNEYKSYQCQKFNTIRSFGRDICSGVNMSNDACEEQIILINFNFNKFIISLDLKVEIKNNKKY